MLNVNRHLQSVECGTFFIRFPTDGATAKGLKNKNMQQAHTQIRELVRWLVP